MFAILMVLAITAASPAVAWNLPWEFVIDFKRYEARDCSYGMIGEKTELVQNECQSWDDEIPFKGFSHCVSGPCSLPICRSLV